VKVNFSTIKRELKMLVLTRKPDESVVITTGSGEEIVVSVLGVVGQQVRLGFDADESIDIVRAELLEDDDQ
jgi:carbon storage regulator CsrA